MKGTTRNTAVDYIDLINCLERIHEARQRFDAGLLPEVVFAAEIGSCARVFADARANGLYVDHFRACLLSLAEGEDWHEAVPHMLVALECAKLEGVAEYVERTLSARHLHRSEATSWRTVPARAV